MKTWTLRQWFARGSTRFVGLCLLGLGCGALAIIQGAPAFPIGFPWILLTSASLAMAAIALFLHRSQNSEGGMPVFQRSHLEFLAKCSNDAVLLLTEDGRILDANDCSDQAFGWIREDLLTMDILKLLEPQSIPSCELEWARIRAQEGQIIETRYLRKDGSDFHAEARSRHFSVDGQDLWQVSIRDISERKQAECQLKDTLNQFRLLVDSVDGIVWESDLVLMFTTFVSRRAEFLLGYPPQRWVTEKEFWRNHLHPDDREKTIRLFDEAEARMEPFSVEYRMIAADGRVVWLQDIVMVTAKDGRPMKLHGVMFDITERKQIEAELKRARDYYFTVLDKLPNPVWQTGPDGRLSYVNKAWLEFSGEAPETALQKQWLDILHPEDADECRQWFQAALEAGDSFMLDRRARHRDGSHHEVQIHGRPLIFKGQFMGHVGTLHDLQNLRQAERDLDRVKDLYNVLIQTGQLIVHAPDEPSLFKGICDIATTCAKFSLAWVGLLDPSNGLIRMAAAEGPLRSSFDHLQTDWQKEHPSGSDPTSLCIQTGRCQIINDVLHEGGMTHWIGLAGQTDVHSVAAFPLWKNGRVIGALTLYSRPPGVFDQDRVELLTEMAQDISFAVDRLAAEEQRRTMEEALRESETNLAKAQEIAQMGSWVWDIPGNRGHWSAGMETIYGFPCNEGSDHLERVISVVHPQDRAHYENRIQRLITTGGTLESDYRIIRADGEERVFQVNAVAEIDGKGCVSLVRGITRDITERKRAEEKVRKTLRHLEDLKSAVDESAVVLIADSRGDITYVNKRLCDLMGYTQEELHGKNPRIFNSNHHPSAYWQEMWAIISSGRIWRGEVRNRSKDGSQRWLDTTIVPFLDEGGNPTQYMAIHFDITDRKQAEEAVQAISSERMALLDAASVAKVVPWSMDLASGSLRMGDSALVVLGKPAKTFHTHPNTLRELLKAEDQKLLIHAQAEARAGLLGSFEAPIKRGEKQVIWTRWTIGRREGLLHGVVQDITEQHELYSQLLQSQKLESLGTLVSGITHDFNNILMGILGYAEVLSAMPDLNPDVETGIGVIRRAAERGRGLVNQLLRFSRRTMATQVMHNLNDIVREVQALMLLPGDDRVRLDLLLDPDLPDTLMDPGQINQVVMNLAVNARDAIAGRGEIRFVTGRTFLDSQRAGDPDRRPGPYLFLEVEDTGMGIRPELFSRIFEPFFTTKGLGKGTGLGLSVVHGIVEAHQGHIQCRSEFGKGTCFRVMLPQITHESLIRDPEHAVPPQSAHRILLLDDPGHSRSTAADLLIYMGNQVVAEGDLEPAIAAHRIEPFHLMIINLDMTDGAGLRILTLLQEAIPGIPIIGGAARDTPELRTLRHQPHALVQWPFRAVELLSAIQRILD